ncbi:MAG: leucine-rich repeat protein [Candidatus Izemoplasmataceae bacterium]
MKKTILFILFLGLLFSASYIGYTNFKPYELHIFYDEEDLENITIITLKYNNEIPSIEDPSKEGYVFSGWYLDREKNTPFDYNFMPKMNLTLYPDWGTEGLNYVKTGSTYTVSSGTATATHIRIPKRHQGALVTVIAYQGFQHKSFIESVFIPNSIESIETRAFYLNTNLKTVEIEEGSVLKIIHKQAFFSTHLESIHIPSSVEIIDEEAFVYNPYLSSLTFGDDSKLQKIGARAFVANYSLESISLPDSLRIIESEAFTACSVLSIVEISSNSLLERIEQNAFNSTALTAIYLPSQLNYIGTYAFNDTLITALYIPISVETIGAYAFRTRVPSQLFTAIYVGAASKPEGWHLQWNQSNYHVVWDVPRQD